MVARKASRRKAPYNNMLTKVMPHAERSARRARMAGEYAAGAETMAQIAGRYGVSVATVMNACHEHGVSHRRVVPRGPMDMSRAAECVRRFLSGENKQSIGISLGITRERTRQVVAAFEREHPALYKQIEIEVLRTRLAALHAA